MTDDFLFELGCEELPTLAVRALSQALAQHLTQALKSAELSYASFHVFATPRRLAILISQLSPQQPPRQVAKRGPAVAQAFDAEGKPTKPLLGFLNACNISQEQLSILKTDKGEWVQWVTDEAGRQATEIVPVLINEALSALPIAKPMRWGEGDARFVRPVHWIVMMYGSAVINTRIFGLQAGQITYGHRFHHPQAMTVEHPQDYEKILHHAFVVADFEKRRSLIVSSVQALAQKHHALAIMPDELVDEVTSIVEWPVSLTAQFEKTFLSVPQDALIASMQTHQKSFALCDTNHRLLPLFITVTNLKSQNTAQIVTGVEKVMRARLSDAHFFFVHDQKQPLDHLVTQTQSVVFQAQLGTLHDKTLRLEALMLHLHQVLNLSIPDIKRAAMLSKCDLLTGMVGEFPELQGVMGYHYALANHETEEVAVALKEQYLPRFSGDALPASPLGAALSLADRIDTLVGNFLIGQRPSGVKDPFKLRRHALAVARLLINTPAPVNLSDLTSESLNQYNTLTKTDPTQIPLLHDFILERLLTYYQAQNIPVDRVQAVLARQRDCLYDLDQRLHALNTFIALPEALHLSGASKRVGHMLTAAGCPITGLQVDAHSLKDPAEVHLFEQLKTVEQDNTIRLEYRDYTAILLALAALRSGIDTFFDTVMVMVEEEGLKRNRLALLHRLQTLLHTVADISCLQWS